MTLLVVEADILLLDPLQDQQFDGAVRWEMLISTMFLKFAQCGEVCRDNSGLYDGWGNIFPTPDAQQVKYGMINMWPMDNQTKTPMSNGFKAF